MPAIADFSYTLQQYRLPVYLWTILKVRDTRSCLNRFSVPNATLGLPGKPVNGGSGPRYYLFDDGIQRLVKWFPSHHGKRMCYNELIASRLGQLIGAPVLRGSVVFVPDEIIPDDHRSTAKPGFQFGVYRMRGENFLPTTHYQEIENRSELASAAVLLAWLDVDDHNRRPGHNQWLQRMEIMIDGSATRESKLFRLVDLGWAFCDGDWTAATVAGISDSHALPLHMAELLAQSEIDRTIESLMEISEDDIRGCLVEFPKEWKISRNDVKAVAARLIETRPKLADIIAKGNPMIRLRP